MDTSDKILLNMAINNTENKPYSQDLKVGEFKKKVKIRYIVYKQIHEEVVNSENQG